MKSNKEKVFYLKKYRKKHNLSQENIAEELNVTRTLISKWENGETVNDEYQEKLAKILDISPILIKCHGNKLEYYKTILKKPFIILGYFLLIFALFLFLIFSYRVLNFYFDNKDNEIIYQELIVDNNEYLELYNSSIFTSNARAFLRLNVKYKIDETLIDKVRLGYFIDDQKYYCFESQPRDFFSFEDNQYEQANIKFAYINEIIDNMFIELELEDGKLEIVSIISNRLYSSKDMFEKPKNVPIINETDNNYMRSQFYDKMAQLGEKVKNNGEIINFKYKDYDIAFFIHDIEYFFNIKNKIGYHQFSYICVGLEYISKYDLKNQKNLYSYVLTTNECENHNTKIDYCDEKENDFILLNDILDFALNNVIN